MIILRTTAVDKRSISHSKIIVNQMEGNKMKNYYFKMDRIDYQNKILDTIDNALNDLKPEEFDVLIQRIQEYIDDLN